MRDVNADNLIMLLSTDWFFPCWPSLGLHLDANQAQRIQAGCRELVRQVVSDIDQYWLANFSDERVNRTRDEFLKLLLECGVTEADAQGFESIIASDSAAQSAWLPTLITVKLVEGTLAPELEPPTSLRSVIEETWESASRDSNANVQCSDADATEWDRFVRDLTPDLPTRLSDYVASIIDLQQFRAFWRALASKSTREELDGVRGWYGSVARVLTEKDFELPDSA